MPYEFLAKNGLISQGNITATGSLTVTQNITASNISASGTIIATSFTGSFSGSIGTAISATSASYALSASYAPTSTNITASWATNSLTASYLTPANSYTIAGLTNNGSLSQQGTLSMGSGYQILATTGTAPVPGISFVGDTNTGIYSPSGDIIAFSISGSERVRIDSNGNVGIGTTSPNRKLHVAGSLESVRLEGSYAIGSPLKLGASYTGTTDCKGEIWFLNPDNGFGGGLSLAVQPNVASAPATASLTVYSNGNVGIGTTSPGALLDVSYGDYQSAGAIRIGADLGANTSRTNNSRKYGSITGYPYNNNSSSVQVIGIDAINSTTTGLTIGGGSVSFASPTQIQFYTTSSTTSPGAERMRIDSSGLVGIGTTSPATTLNVSGSTRISAGELQIEGDNASIRLYRTTGINYFDWASGQNLYLGTVTSIGGAGRSNKMVILDGGNVGIGTSSPSTKLAVEGGSVSAVNITGSDVRYSFDIRTLVGGAIGFNNTAATNVYGVVTGSAYFGVAQSYPIVFTTNGTERIRIDAGGNVGIGTANPIYSLDVTGNGRVGDFLAITTATTADAKIEIGTGRSGNGNSYIDLVGDATYTDYGLRLIRSNGGANTTSAIAHRGTGTLYITAVEAAAISLETSNTTRMTITSGGNVGIGTSSPGAELEVSGSPSDVLFNLKSPLSGNIIYVSGSGRIGINKSNPISVLDVSGSVTITGSLNLTTNVTCLSLTETSTEAVKYNISPLPSQLENVLKLKPVSFNYKTNNKHSIGLIAEEVAKIYPEFTSETNDSISYGKITSVLIQSIKELKNIIDNQQKQIEDLSNKLKQF